MKRDRMRPAKRTTARVAPDGKPNAFARTMPITAKKLEKRVLIKKVCLMFCAKVKAKNPGTKSRVSTKTVPASLMLVTIKKESKTKKV